MKQLLIVFFLVPVMAWAQQKGFVITGNITGLAENSRVTLTDLNKNTDTVARAVVHKGTFVLKGSVAEPNLYQLNFESGAKKSILFIGNEHVSIKGDVNMVQLFDIKGSPTNSDFAEFQNIFNPLFQKFTALNQRMYSDPSAQKNDSLVNSLKKSYEAIVAAIDKFVLNKKSSPVTPFMLVVTHELEQDPVTLEKRFNMLSPEIQQGFFGKILQQSIAEGKIGAVGTDAIEFTQADTTGKPVSLNSFRGKYVLVDFWASWCTPCRMENPNVVAAYKRFQNKNFTILGVSLDKAREPWIQAIRQDGLTWTQVSDLKYWNNEAARKYKVDGIPKNFLIDPNGKIVGRDLRGPALEAKLCELLGCN